MLSIAQPWLLSSSTPRFVPQYEDLLLLIIPTCVFLAIAAVYIARLLTRPTVVRQDAQVSIKLSSIICLLIVDLARLSHCHTFLASETVALLSYPTLALVGSISVILMLKIETTRSEQPSTISSMYIAFTILGDTNTLHHCFSDNIQQMPAPISIVSIILKLLFLNLTTTSLNSFQNTVSWTNINRLWIIWITNLVAWVNATLLLGFRTNPRMDMLPDLGPDFDAAVMGENLQVQWELGHTYGRHRLLITSLRAMKSSIIAVIIPRLLYLGFLCAQPVLIERIVSVGIERTVSPSAIKQLTAATAVIYLGTVFSRHSYTKAIDKHILRIRGCLVSVIYSKMLKLEHSTIKENPALALISSDVQSIEKGLPSFYQLWASLFEVSISMCLLTWFIGYAAPIVLLPTILASYLSFIISSHIGENQAIVNAKMEERISTTADSITQIQPIKVVGLADAVAAALQRMLEAEVDTSAKSRLLTVLLFGINFINDYATPTSLFGVALFWTRAKFGFSIPAIFATLATVNIAADAVGVLVPSMRTTMRTLSRLERIQNYLLLDELTDAREGTKTILNQGLAREPVPLKEDSEEPKIIPQLTRMEKEAIQVQENTVRAQRLSFMPLRSGKSLLRDINVVFLAYQLTAIIGPISSGKSALLQSLLGELKMIEGKIYIDKKSIAYCGQVPWLRNASLQANIVGENPFSLMWYEAILYACDLFIDIQNLRDGDQTMIGDGGVVLSEGQKHRVALARALYMGTSILILDNIFSGIDPKTASAIFYRLFSKQGLLRGAKVTVIMTTSIYEHTLLADQIYCLDGKGSIRKVDTVDESLRADFLQCEADLQNTDTVASSSANNSTSTPNSVTPPLGRAWDANEEAADQLVDASVYWFYVKSFGWIKFVVWILCMALAALLERSPWMFLHMALVSEPENRDFLAGFVAYAVVGTCFSFGVAWFFLMRIIPGSVVSLHKALVGTVMAGSLDFFSRVEIGALLKMFNDDISVFAEALPFDMLLAAVESFAVVVDTRIILNGVHRTILIVAIPLLLTSLALLRRCYLRITRQTRNLYNESTPPILNQYTETANGIQHIRVMNWKESYKRQMVALVNQSQKRFYYLLCSEQWLQTVLGVAVAILAIVLVNIALRSPTTSSSIGIGMALLKFSKFARTMRNIIKHSTAVESSMTAVVKLRTLMEKAPKTNDPVLSLKETEKLLSNWSNEGRVEIVRMSAKYNAEDRQSRRILDNVTMICEPGQRMGVVGRTGCGKTSLLLSVLNLVDYTGSILIDGVELRTIPRKLLERRITTIPQETIQIAGSVRMNLCAFYYNDRELRLDAAAQEQMKEELAQNRMADSLLINILEHVGIWEHIHSLGGLDADLKAMNLSQGQKQLLNVARAATHHHYNNSRIVLMDEVTSQIEGHRDGEMQDIMMNLFANCTMLVVAHRGESIRRMDSILYLDAGGLSVSN